MDGKAIHRCLHVLDLEKSIAFYEKALGMTEIRRMGPEDGSWTNVFMGSDASGFQLELTWNRGRTEPYDNGGRDSHLAFTVDDYEAARALHEEMGCICHVNEAMGLYFIEDPDGCWLEILPNKAEFAPQAGVDVLDAMARRRSLRSGAYASVLAVVVLVLVILLNLVVGAVPTKFTQFDISTGKMFTLSDTTKTMLQELNTDVTAYYLAETGNEDSNITRILDRYAGESSHFTWQQRDPALYPTFAQQYDAQNASSSSVILVCGDNHTVVDYNDMYTADYSSYYTTGSYTMSFSAENALSSGIAKVTRENSYVLYQLTGHGESSLESDFTETLDNSGVTAQDLNLLTTDTVPEDAAALLINDPQADLSTLDAAAIKTYLENGGHLFVTTDLTVSTPNLDALLAEYGMTRQEGLVIENDSNYYLYGTAQTCLLPNLSSNEITAGVTDGMHVFTPVAQGIVKGDSTDDLTLTTLLSTSSTAYSMQDYAEATTAEQGANDPNGPFNIAVAASNSTTGAKVVWVNCANLLNSKGIEYVAREYASLLIGGNAQLLTSTMNWMTGEENGVVIDSKSMSAETLTVPAKAIMLLGLLFTIVVPLAFIVAGIAITLVRRRR